MFRVNKKKKHQYDKNDFFMVFIVNFEHIHFKIQHINLVFLVVTYIFLLG